MRLHAFLVLLLMSAGCATMSYGARYPSKEALDAKTVDMNFGMSAPEVLRVLGEPDEKSASICGTLTQHAWKCVMWRYRTNNQFLRMTVTFQGASGGMRADPETMTVNAWDWL